MLIYSTTALGLFTHIITPLYRRNDLLIKVTSSVINCLTRVTFDLAVKAGRRLEVNVAHLRLVCAKRREMSTCCLATVPRLVPAEPYRRLNKQIGAAAQYQHIPNSPVTLSMPSRSFHLAQCDAGSCDTSAQFVQRQAHALSADRGSVLNF